MSDFLKSLVARQLGEATAVRPRLAGRYEPPADAFAPEAPSRAAEFEEPDADALELFLEVETRPAPSRDDAQPSVFNEEARAPRRNPDETSTRVVFVNKEREESQPASSPERSPAQTSGRTHEAAPSSDSADTRVPARVREESDVPVRPKSIVPSLGEETARASVEGARDARPHAESGVDERVPERPSVPTRSLSSFTPRARTRDERREPSRRETRAPSRHEAEDSPSHSSEASRPPSSNVRPATSSTLTRIEPRDVRRASDAPSPFTQTDSTRPRESLHSRDDAGESDTRRHARPLGQESGAFEPPSVRRVARQAAMRDASHTQAEVPPTINVTIGRVEVRATQAPQATPRRKESTAPRMSLDDYLRRRNGEVRE